MQASASLADWINDANVVASPDGWIECLMDMETNAPACCYRLRGP